jgi:hypothetical protein
LKRIDRRSTLILSPETSMGALEDEGVVTDVCLDAGRERTCRVGLDATTMCHAPAELLNSKGVTETQPGR